MPVSTAATVTESAVQISSGSDDADGQIPLRILGPCVVVETVSKPIYAKKMYAAPALMPRIRTVQMPLHAAMLIRQNSVARDFPDLSIQEDRRAVEALEISAKLSIAIICE